MRAAVLLGLSLLACRVSHERLATATGHCGPGCVAVERRPLRAAYCYEIDALHCDELPECELLHPGCGEERGDFAGPACFPRLAGSRRCGFDGDCPSGRACKPTGTHPCIDQPCESCWREAQLCLPLGIR